MLQLPLLISSSAPQGKIFQLASLAFKQQRRSADRPHRINGIPSSKSSERDTTVHSPASTLVLTSRSPQKKGLTSASLMGDHRHKSVHMTCSSNTAVTRCHISSKHQSVSFPKCADSVLVVEVRHVPSSAGKTGMPLLPAAFLAQHQFS